MRLVVDSNIAFNAILHTNSKASQLLLMPRNGLNFYSTHQLLEEIDEHSKKIMELSGYSLKEFNQLRHLFSKRIIFISPELIPVSIWRKAEKLTSDITMMIQNS